MRTLVNKIRHNYQVLVSYPPFTILERIGNLSFKQLATLRHRGAFSTVSKTFAHCCQVTEIHRVTSQSTQESLLLQWYHVCGIFSISCYLFHPATHLDYILPHSSITSKAYIYILGRLVFLFCLFVPYPVHLPPSLRLTILGYS